MATEAQPKAEPKPKRPRATTPEDLGTIRLTCLDKEIDLELIFEKW